MKPRGQMLIVIAILLIVVLMLLAVAVDGGRLMIERTRLRHRPRRRPTQASLSLPSRW
jgi:uncharacterized membrane protein